MTSLMLWFIIGIFFDTPTLARPKKKKKRFIRAKAHYSLLTTLQANEIAPSTVNLNNQVYRLPNVVFSSEFRPNLELKHRSKVSLAIRPRLRFSEQQIETLSSSPATVEVKREAFVNELFLLLKLAKPVELAIGPQNFQWGPTELGNPSNIIFRESSINRAPFTEVRGKNIVRVNYSPSQQISIIGLVEYAKNADQRPSYETQFHKKAVFKTEFADSSQTNYLGLVVSGANGERHKFGLYGNVELIPGLSGYFDSKLGQGSDVWYPPAEGLLDNNFLQSRLEDRDYKFSGILGFYYGAENGSSYRLEGFHDPSAWDKQERERAKLVLLSNLNEVQVRRFLDPGTLLPGRRFIYGSMRFPDLGPTNSININVRILHSVEDQSQSRNVNVDTFLNDYSTMNIGFTEQVGPVDGELSQLFKYSGYLSLSLTF